VTTSQIIKTIGRAGKSISVPTLYRLLSKLDIKPAGANQRPQNYPSDSATKIAEHLGLEIATSSSTKFVELTPSKEDVDNIKRSLLPIHKIKSAKGKAKK